MQWKIREAHRPAPAWPTSRRMPFDRAYRVVIAEGRLYYGTSADDRLVCRDTATGQPLWTFVADGPVRLAPAVANGRVYVGSDDGWLYCLNAADGRVCWQRRGGPADQRVLGNDRMIARWPVRGGPVVRGRAVCFGAGIWPSEGIYLYALDADSGNVLWKNDSSGGLDMAQPHPGARAAAASPARTPGDRKPR